jgi:hypothetical protein
VPCHPPYQPVTVVPNTVQSYVFSKQFTFFTLAILAELLPIIPPISFSY